MEAGTTFDFLASLITGLSVAGQVVSPKTIDKMGTFYKPLTSLALPAYLDSRQGKMCDLVDRKVSC